MYTLIHRAPDKKALLLQTIPFASSLVIAEFFYKFHSFTLECLAFLATWYVIDWLLTSVMRLAARKTTA